MHLFASHTATATAPAESTRSSGPRAAPRTPQELRELASTVLRRLFPGQARLDLFFVDGAGDLVPAVDQGDGPFRSGQHLLTSLRAREVVGARDLGEAKAFPPLRNLRRGAILVAPLRDACHAAVGAVVVEAPAGAPDFSAPDLTALEGIATLLSAAVQRMRAGAAARVERELEEASRVQRRLMSFALPEGGPVTAHAEYLPASGIGGDFYSVSDLGDGTVTLAIGDVSGHGVSAALVMSRVAAEIDRALAAGVAPARVLGAVNSGLAGVDTEMFVTAACLRLDTRRRTLRIANAGHLPVVVRHADGTVRTHGDASGLPLGMLSSEYDEEEIALRAGDIVVLLTDGLLEALDHPSGQRGMEMLVEMIRSAPHDAKTINQRIRAVVDRARSRHVLDDVTWVGVQLAA